MGPGYKKRNQGRMMIQTQDVAVLIQTFPDLKSDKMRLETYNPNISKMV